MRKTIKFEPVFNENVNVKNVVAENGRRIYVSKDDDVNINIAVTTPGWGLGSLDAKECLRKMMHEKVDRQIDRFIYRD